MATSTVPCPHCKSPVTVTVGQIERCPACGGEVRVHEVGKDVKDEALQRLLSSVKIVERVGGAPPPPSKPRQMPAPPLAAPPPKRPWWKFWG
jgi:hypothetical protein